MKSNFLAFVLGIFTFNSFVIAEEPKNPFAGKYESGFEIEVSENSIENLRYDLQLTIKKSGKGSLKGVRVKYTPEEEPEYGDGNTPKETIQVIASKFKLGKAKSFTTKVDGKVRDKGVKASFSLTTSDGVVFTGTVYRFSSVTFVSDFIDTNFSLNGSKGPVSFHRVKRFSDLPPISLSHM